MANDSKKKNGLPSQASLTFRIVVGAYLLYLAYTLGGNLPGYEGRDFIVFVIATIVFVIAGILIIANAIKTLKSGEYLNGPADFSDDEEENDTEENDKEMASEKEDIKTHSAKRIRFDENDDIHV